MRCEFLTNPVFRYRAWIAHNDASVPAISTRGVEGTSYPLLNDAEAGPFFRLSVFPAFHILGPLGISCPFPF